jgi:hypothetical protein
MKAYRLEGAVFTGISLLERTTADSARDAWPDVRDEKCQRQS